MARLTPTYSANRVVRGYTERHYIPAAQAYSARANQEGKLAKQITEWERSVRRGWSRVRFGPMRANSESGRLRFEVTVHLDGLDPGAIRLELYADGVNGSQASRIPMNREAGSAHGGVVYSESLRHANDFTPRVLPNHPAALIPLEASQILQK